MYLQITNTSKKRDELVNNKYKELDGRMNKRGKQFAQRAGL